MKKILLAGFFGRHRFAGIRSGRRIQNSAGSRRIYSFIV